MRWVWILVINVILWAGAWFGPYQGNQLVDNGLFWMVWIFIVFGALITAALSTTEFREKLKKDRKPMPKWYSKVELSNAFLFCLTIAALGWFFTAFCWFLVSFFGRAETDKLDAELRELQ